MHGLQLKGAEEEVEPVYGETETLRVKDRQTGRNTGRAKPQKHHNYNPPLGAAVFFPEMLLLLYAEDAC